MTRLPLYLLGLILVPTASASDWAVNAEYGQPVDYTRGTVRLPSFRLRLKLHRDRARLDNGSIWQNDIFEAIGPEAPAPDAGIVDPNGGSFTFSSDHGVNARTFDFQGATYAAEMYTTSTDDRTEPIPDGKIIIWDRATAEAHNHALAELWEDHRNTLAGESHAFRKGTIVPGFGDDETVGETSAEDSRFDSGFPLGAKLARRRVPLLSADEIDLRMQSRVSVFGERVRYDHGPLSFPGFVLALVERDGYPAGGERHAPTYLKFSAYDAVTGEVRSKFIATEQAGQNGFAFQVYRAGYLAELYRTTAGSAVGDPRPADDLPRLAPGECIIWNRASAQAANPRIAGAWAADGQTTADGPIALTSFANGVRPPPLDATYSLAVTGAISTEDLDRAPAPIGAAALPYPPELTHSGYRLTDHGYLTIRADGTVKDVTLFDPNQAINTALQAGLLRWHFSRPTRDGKAIEARLPIWFELSEEQAGAVVLHWR